MTGATVFDRLPGGVSGKIGSAGSAEITNELTMENRAIENVAFMALFYKTPVYEAVADLLAARGAAVFWISTNEKQYAHLAEKYGAARVLFLDRSMIGRDAEPVDDFRINEILYSDRVFKYDIPSGIRFLTNIQRPVYDFIAGNGIRVIIGENTMSHELLTLRMCHQRPELGCRYVSTLYARIPNGRFFLMADERLTEVIEKPVGAQESMPAGQTLRLEKPVYLKNIDRIVDDKMSWRGRMRRLGDFITGRHIVKSDPLVCSGWARFAVPAREVMNQMRYTHLHRVQADAVKGRKYVLFGFHKQPESSIDVCGRYYDDQAQNVLNLWRQLPPGWLLVIKEHSNAVGDRSPEFFRRLLKYPGIVLMHEKADSHELIRGAQLVASNTGTMSLEAALMDVPAITFSRVVFNRLNRCRHCGWEDMAAYDNLEALIDSIRSEPDNRAEYSEFVMANSWRGMPSDVYSMPSVLDPENIAGIAAAVYSLIGQQK